MNVNALLIDPQTTTTIYAATTSGVYKTTDGGNTWANMTASVGANGLARKLVIDPTNSAILYAATNRGMLRTADRGNSWAFVNTGLPGTPDILALEIDPASPNTLYAYNNFSAGVVYKTTNGGANWQASLSFLQITFNNLTFRTNCFGFAINGSRVLAATLLGLFLSTDGGTTWTLNAQVVPLNSGSGFLQDRTNPAVVYAAMTSGADAFVTKLNATGSALVYSRYLGGESPDLGRSIAVDNSGNAWLTGQTASVNFPTVNATQTRYGFMTDLFVTKVNASGSALSFSTYHGGTLGELGYGIALDGAGNAYVAGWTQSTDFPVVNALISSAPGGFNAVVAKYKADGSAVDYSTYLGGSRNDQAFALAVDTAGNALIAGTTASPDFPTVGALQTYNTQNTSGHAFLTRLSPDGRRIGFSTWLGGRTNDQANAVALDAQGNVYLAGTTSSPDFPTANPLFGLSGVSDAFIAKLSASADVALTMTAAPAPAALNSNLTYTMRVTNNGELNATNVRLTDVLPSGATFVSATASQGACTGTATVNCTLGNLNVGATATVTIVIQPPARLTISNVAEVTANEPDGNLTNNRVTVESNVNFYDLAVTISSSNDRVIADGTHSYLVSVANRNGAAIDNVTLNFILPAGLSFVDCIPEFGTCGGTGNQRVVTMARLERGQTRSVTFSARVLSPVSVGTVFMTTANVEPTSADSNLANNSASASVAVVSALLRAHRNGKIYYGLAYLNNNDARNGFYEVNPDGSNLRRLSTSSLGRSVTWSPNGDVVAYFIKEDHSSSMDLGDSIYVSGLDGSNKRRIATRAAFNDNTRLSWSPDGTRVLFSTTNGEFSGSASRFLSIANADGSGQTSLPNSPTRVNDPDWSPDGDRVAFARDGEIWVVNLNGTELKRIAARLNFGDVYSRPRWSPDGSQILFSKGTTNDNQAMLVKPDGTGLTRALNVPRSINASWSPDGKKILYTGYRELACVNYDGGNPVKISPPDAIYVSEPEWQPLPVSGTPQPLPTPETFSIKGRVFDPTNDLGAPSLSFNMRISGDAVGLAPQGDPAQSLQEAYEAVRLPRGGTYTLTPESLSRRFEPTSRTITNLQNNVTGIEFKTFFRPLSIRGRITDPLGLPMVGVGFYIFAGGGPTPTTETDENGYYAINNRFGGSYYTITPSGDSVRQKFQPAEAKFDPLTQNETADFIVNRVNYEIVCEVIDPSGNPTTGVTVTLDGNGSTRTATTNSAGLFTFTDVTGSSVYTVKVNKAGTMIAAPERQITANGNKRLRFISGASTAIAVSAASYRPTDITPRSIISVFGSGLAQATQSANTNPLPKQLEGVTATLTGRGYERDCPLFFVSPTQLNLWMPFGFDPFADFAPTDWELAIKQNGVITAVAALRSRSLAPSLFSVEANGQGLAAALALRVKANGQQTYEPIAAFNAVQNRFVSVPLDVSNPAEQVFLILFGTGTGYLQHFRTDLNLTIANQSCEIVYAGPQGSFYGLDQVNVLLPTTLAGRGEAEIRLTTPEGGAANVVKLNLK